jgi:hypothetical protein
MIYVGEVESLQHIPVPLAPPLPLPLLVGFDPNPPEQRPPFIASLTQSGEGVVPLQVAALKRAGYGCLFTAHHQTEVGPIVEPYSGGLSLVH